MLEKHPNLCGTCQERTLSTEPRQQLKHSPLSNTTQRSSSSRLKAFGVIFATVLEIERERTSWRGWVSTWQRLRPLVVQAPEHPLILSCRDRGCRPPSWRKRRKHLLR